MPAALPSETLPSDTSGAADETRHPYLLSLGERVRAARSRRALTRKAVALAADVSERHLANLEYGLGNASILVLLQVAGALHCSLAELIGDVSSSSPEWLLLRELLEGRDETTLRRVREAVGSLLATENAAGDAPANPKPHVALIGLRGAGKSTLGRRLSTDLGCAFVEISHEVQALAGCSVAEIQALYGMAAYRRYERRALEVALQTHSKAVIAAPGGLVSDAASFRLLLSQCTTVWLQARAEDHMQRVHEQGDLRPMAASAQAMKDLRGILASRAAFYGQATLRLDTSAQPLEATFQALRKTVRGALRLAL